MRKDRLLLCLLIVIALTALASTAVAERFVCGDSDASGGVDIDDVVYLINYIFTGGPAPNPYESGDANASGGVDIDDVVYLINYIFAGGPAPMCSCGTVTDIDGNVYQTILIGDQCWMAENLKVTRYRTGDPLPNVTDDVTWYELTIGAYCNFENDEGYVATYGRMYNWFAVADGRNLAPEGWHVPSDEEWKQLEMYLGMSQAEADAVGNRGTDEGGKLKEAGTMHWEPINTGATNESGFTALPGGSRDIYGDFYPTGFNGYFWCSTESDIYRGWLRHLYYLDSQVGRYNHPKQHGFSVRCVKD